MGKAHVRIIATSTLKAYGAEHPDAEAALEYWAALMRSKDFGTPQEVQQSFPKAKVLNGERVRFEIRGGTYRLIAAFDFRRRIAVVKFIGPHAEYDRIDALKIEMF